MLVLKRARIVIGQDETTAEARHFWRDKYKTCSTSGDSGWLQDMRHWPL